MQVSHQSDENSDAESRKLAQEVTLAKDKDNRLKRMQRRCVCVLSRTSHAHVARHMREAVAPVAWRCFWACVGSEVLILLPRGGLHTA